MRSRIYVSLSLIILALLGLVVAPIQIKDAWALTCSITSAQTAYLVYSSGGSNISACNTKTGAIEYTNTEVSSVVNYAISHLDGGRSTIQTVTVNGTFTGATNKINLVSYTELKLIGSYTASASFLDNALIGTTSGATQKQAIKINGGGTLSCNLGGTTAIVSGTYMLNVTNYQIKDLTFTSCPHVGLYTKGFQNGNVTNVVSHDNVGRVGAGVGTNFGFFGGHNNVYTGLIGYGACGALGNGIQIEANDEVTSGSDFYSTNTMSNVTMYNNCGYGFVASNVGTGNTVSSFNIHDSGLENVDQDSGQGIAFSSGTLSNAGTSVNNKYYNMNIAGLGSSVTGTTITQGGITNKAAGGIYFRYVPSLPGFSASGNTISGVPIGIDIAGKSATIGTNTITASRFSVIFEATNTGNI